ncbi:hypothetical protein [Streptomyces sp. CB02009]|uniref:hypothetical protein n=1 Tax=Streptomyces sp. CB02009 TaxID=1703938 RepID=UPI0011610C55|nr:hypothetical protein [Streptomyces sp. CB02009]
MNPIHKITSLDEAWNPGDIAFDADGNLRVRSDNPNWAWDYPNEGHTRDQYGTPHVPTGGIEDKDVSRPLILLVRNGQAVGGRQLKR